MDEELKKAEEKWETERKERQIKEEQAKKMELYGAEGVVFMDSSGHYLPEDVQERVALLVSELSIMVGFHGHNNLGLAVANKLGSDSAVAKVVI
jgi:4-hydroxy 2-oxovalerate aldolase